MAFDTCAFASVLSGAMNGGFVKVRKLAMLAVLAWAPLLLALGACSGDEPPSLVMSLGPDADVDAPSDSSDSSAHSPGDASAEGSTDAALETGDAVAEAGSDAEASGDSAVDSSSDGALAQDADAGFDSDAAPVCGDGVVDPPEECDDSVVNVLLDSCSSLCEVRDLVAHRAPTDAGLASRTLGLGRHPISGSSGGFAVSWIEPVGPKLGMTFYDAKGIPSGTVDRFAVSSTALLSSAPVVAALPGGTYAAAWTDLGGDGDAEGIALRLVNPNVASVGAPVHANSTLAYSQYDADIVWTGAQIVVAWADTSNVSTGPDLKFRSFDANLNPTSAEQTLAGSSAIEGNVALSTFAGGWAAAWREATGGLETIRVKAGSVGFSVGPFVPGPYDAPPALTELDATHLLLVYVEGNKLRGATLALSQPGTTTPFDVAPLTQGSTPPAAIWPNAVRAGSRLFVAWSSDAVLADPRAEETWLKEVSWNGTALDLTRSEVPLPRWDAHRLGDQRFPALTAVGSNLAGAWLDLGNTFANAANADVAVEFMPLPLSRKNGADGGGL